MDAPSKTRDRARELRQRLSPPEVKLWMRLRQRLPNQPIFRRQHPIGPYILDFYCHEAQLCVGVDGQGHHDEERAAHDERRTKYLNGLGIEVVRCAAITVLRDADEIAEGVSNLAAARIRERALTDAPAPTSHRP